MKVKHADEVATEAVGAGSGTTKQVLVGPEEAPNFALRRFTMQPGGGMPRHTNLVEHEQYVLRGRATIGIGDEEIRVREGDVLYIPAGVPHWYRAEGDEPFQFLCAVPNAPDRIEILEERDGGEASEARVERWDEARDGPPTEEALRARLEARGYRVGRYTYTPGTRFPEHAHDVDKIDAVVSGRFRMTVEGEEVVLGPGDAVAVPAGTVHTAEVVGREPVVSLDATRAPHG